jgi:hypothetical protein
MSLSCMSIYKKINKKKKTQPIQPKFWQWEIGNPGISFCWPDLFSNTFIDACIQEGKNLTERNLPNFSVFCPTYQNIFSKIVVIEGEGEFSNDLNFFSVTNFLHVYGDCTLMAIDMCPHHQGHSEACEGGGGLHPLLSCYVPAPHRAFVVGKIETYRRSTQPQKPYR